MLFYNFFHKLGRNSLGGDKCGIKPQVFPSRKQVIDLVPIAVSSEMGGYNFELWEFVKNPYEPFRCYRRSVRRYEVISCVGDDENSLFLAGTKNFLPYRLVYIIIAVFGMDFYSVYIVLNEVIKLLSGWSEPRAIKLGFLSFRLTAKLLTLCCCLGFVAMLQTTEMSTPLSFILFILPLAVPSVQGKRPAGADSLPRAFGASSSGKQCV